MEQSKKENGLDERETHTKEVRNSKKTHRKKREIEKESLSFKRLYALLR